MPPFARFAVWILRSIEVFFPRFICAIGMDVRPLLDGTFDYGIFVNILNENQMACIYMYVNGVLMQCSSHTVCLCVILDIHNRDMYWCLSDISTLGVIEFNQPWLSWECVFDIIEFKFALKKININYWRLITALFRLRAVHTELGEGKWRSLVAKERIVTTSHVHVLYSI